VASDARELHDLWTTPGVRRFLWDDCVIPFEQTATTIETSVRLFAERGFGLWGARRHDRPRLVGFGGFWYFREPPELELLYGVAEEAWGAGVATDVGRAIVEYGRRSLRMPVIHASTDLANAASVRVLEKLGFRHTRRAAIAGLDTVFYESVDLQSS
jgi:ribosomal-protein-alanine N-acetyltransferase